MDNCPLISVVVPIFNEEDRLRECVGSLVAQSYEHIEIILVNDGSTDQSGSLCDVLAQKDDRIRVIHKANGGLSSARNAGLEMSSGEYIGFVDSDDTVSMEMYEILLDRIHSDESGLAICGIRRITGVGNQSKTYEYCPFEGVYSGNNALSLLCTNDYWIYVTAVNRLYKREILGENPFPERRLHEDEFTAFSFLEKAVKISTISDALYNYNYKENSITSSKMTIRNLDAVDALIDRTQGFLARGMSIEALWTSKMALILVAKGFCEIEAIDSSQKAILKNFRKRIIGLIRPMPNSKSVFKKSVLLMLFRFFPCFVYRLHMLLAKQSKRSKRSAAFLGGDSSEKGY